MKTDGETLKVGIVGCGRATEELHIPALQQLKGIKVVALAGLETDRLNRVGDLIIILASNPKLCHLSCSILCILGKAYFSSMLS